MISYTILTQLMSTAQQCTALALQGQMTYRVEASASSHYNSDTQSKQQDETTVCSVKNDDHKVKPHKDVRTFSAIPRQFCSGYWNSKVSPSKGLKGFIMRLLVPE